MKCLPRGTLVVAMGGLLLACGQKGPLVLPDAPKHKRSAVPQASPVKPHDNTRTPNPASDSPASDSPAGGSAAGQAPANSAPTAPSHSAAAPVSRFNGAAPTPLTRPS